MIQSSLDTVGPDLLRLCRPGGPLALSPPPGISLYARDAPSPLENYLYDPVLCMVLQGAKTMRSGAITLEIAAGDALVVSHHLPVVSQITQASVAAPYLAIVLTLDVAMIRELFAQIGTRPDGPGQTGAIDSTASDPVWLDPLRRYLALHDRPQDQRVLGPSLLREVHYRLLTSRNGAILRNIAVGDTRANRIARAISLIRSDVSAPLKVASLAGEIGMSVSAFHAHFRAVTGTTPLQYQKDLRLITARGVLTSGGTSVATAAFQVGYESPTHFSRDYKRKFGHSPSKPA